MWRRIVAVINELLNERPGSGDLIHLSTWLVETDRRDETMIFGRVVAMAALFSVAGALAGCATGGAGNDRPRVENYTTEDLEYHRFHHHVRLGQVARTIAGFGSH